MKKKYGAEDVLDAGWHTTREDGSFPGWDVIGALATIAVGHEVRKLRSVMQQILYNMQSLGSDGIHDVIKHEAKRARRAKKQAAGKRKARRLAALFKAA
jgi:hypothetical protein